MSTFSQQSALDELHTIAQWWLDNACDHDNGGFYGEIDSHNQPIAKANKGIILNSRILWFFSELAYYSPKPAYKAMANRAFDYFLDYFDDAKNGGVVWELDFQGKVVQGKKQIYALCFCIYGLTAYFKLSNNSLAKEKALAYFRLIEDNARDYDLGGYIEALSNDWGDLEDYRLSDKDLNAPKTTNTHLHILEAYSALHQTFPSAETKEALSNILTVFKHTLIEKGHLKLFFDQQWNDLSQHYSYGHEIEASWLIWEALEVLDDKALSVLFRPIVIKMAETSLHEGLGAMGQLCDDLRFDTHSQNTGSIWWVQAEALIGFLNAYKLTGKSQFLNACTRIWYFIFQYHKDKKLGEWFWLANESQESNGSHYKAGFWKAPYHNGRAMIEVSKRLSKIDLKL